eukprot:gene5397-5276_t
MAYSAYQQLLPATEGRKRLVQAANAYLGLEFDCEFALQISPDKIPQACLDGTAQLGRTAWLGELQRHKRNPYVQLVHWVAQILQQDDSDWHHILRYFELDASAVLADVQRALERQPGGAQGISDLSESITNAVERAWVYGSLLFGAQKVRTGHVLVALLKTDFLLHELLKISPRFKQIPEAALSEQFAQLVANSAEQSLLTADVPPGALPGQASGAMPAAQLGGALPRQAE